jgi:hypothetical protein
MLLLITKRRGPDSDTKDEEFTLEIDSRSSFEEVKKCIENMKGIPVKKRVLWCDSCSGTQLEDNDTLDNPELNFSKLIMLVNDDKVKPHIFSLSSCGGVALATRIRFSGYYQGS